MNYYDKLCLSTKPFRRLSNYEYSPGMNNEQQISCPVRCPINAYVMKPGNNINIYAKKMCGFTQNTISGRQRAHTHTPQAREHTLSPREVKQQINNYWHKAVHKETELSYACWLYELIKALPA